MIILLLLIIIVFLFNKESFVNTHIIQNNDENLTNEISILKKNSPNLDLVEVLNTLNKILNKNNLCNQITKYFHILDKSGYLNNYNTNSNYSNLTFLIPLNKIMDFYGNSYNIIPDYYKPRNTSLILNSILKEEKCDDEKKKCIPAPYTKDNIINNISVNFEISDFYISNIKYNNGIIHIVNFLIENINDSLSDIKKKDIFQKSSGITIKNIEDILNC